MYYYPLLYSRNFYQNTPYYTDERFCAFPFLGLGIGLLGGFAAGALVTRPPYYPYPAPYPPYSPYPAYPPYGGVPYTPPQQVYMPPTMNTGNNVNTF